MGSEVQVVAHGERRKPQTSAPPEIHKVIFISVTFIFRSSLLILPHVLPLLPPTVLQLLNGAL